MAARPNFIILLVREDKLYVCDEGNGTIRVINIRTLFCHTSRIGQENAEESQSAEEDCAVRRIRKVEVHDLSFVSVENVPD